MPFADVMSNACDILIDGMLSGTGIRDVRNGGYLKPSELNLSSKLTSDICTWQKTYEDIHFHGFPSDQIDTADSEGLKLAKRLQHELPQLSVGYFSHGLMERLA